MKRWTYSEFRAKLERDLDLESLDFVSSEEIRSLTNEAIDITESHIHQLGQEDEYFLTKDSLALVPGQSEYELPEDIYGNKLRAVYFDNGSDKYTVRRFQGKDKFTDFADVEPEEEYRYLIIHDSDSTPRMVFGPAPRDSGPAITRWYIRNAKWIEADTDYLDLPECAVNHALAFVRYRVLLKEGSPLLPAAKEDLDSMLALMIGTLSEMVPDGDNEIKLDLTAYEEHY